MRLGDGGQPWKIRLTAAVATALTMWIAAFMLNASLLVQTGAFLTGLLAGYLVANTAAVLGGVMMSTIMWISLVVGLDAFTPTYGISGPFVLWGVVILAVVCTVLLRRFLSVSDDGVSLAGMSLTIVILGYLYRSSPQWTSETAFDSLVRNGEDNAAWLLALSRSVVEGETQLNTLSGTSGGPGTGVVVTFFREAMDTFGKSSLISNADNGLVLMRSYVLVALIVAMLWHVTAQHLLKDKDWVTRLGSSMLVTVVSVSLVNGLAAVGHFSAVVAGMYLSLALYFQTIEFQVRVGSRVLQRMLVTFSLMAAGQSWFPLTGLALLYVLLTIVVFVWPYLSKRPTARQIKIAAGFLVVIVASGYVAYQRLFAAFLQNVTSVEFITRNLTIAGGYSTVHPWIVVGAFTVCIWWAFGNSRTQDLLGLRVLVTVLILPIVGLFTWSYFLAPFTPQYGAWKYLYIGVMATAPIALLSVPMLINKSTAIGIQRLVPAMLFFVMVTFSPPWNQIRWADTVTANGYDFSSVIVSELRENPERPVGCLATEKDSAARNYIAYLCSRMAMGLGGFDEVVHRVWTAGNICTISPPQAKAEFTMEFQQNLTVILFDGTRTSSFAECQAPSEEAPNGWLSPIDWDVIRKIDQYGKVVEIPATRPE